MSYPEALRYLESFINYENIPSYPYQKSLNLKRLNKFLSFIGNPQDSLYCIHVAGSKGKGSTCAFIAYILREAGFKVGLYTSPHLHDFRERIRVLKPNSSKDARLDDFEGAISKAELIRLVKKLKQSIRKYNLFAKYGKLTFFEVYTVLAFLYFKETKVDLVVLETGLGGRLDATNVVTPLICAITPISYEHMDKLGHSLRSIAREKAGIIKYQSIVVSSLQEAQAARVIREKSRVTSSKLYSVGSDIKFKAKKDNFDCFGLLREYKNLKIKLRGIHQIINATTAIAVAEKLNAYGFKVGVDSIRRGLYNTLWPGRCEVIGHSPYIVLDGAQNLASASALSRTIRDSFKYQKLFLVLGISSDKDIKGITSELYDIADKVILTKANNLRAADPHVLAKYFNGKETYITNNVADARELVKKISAESDLILVTGSLFVVGEFRYDKKQFN